jgi:hypothetical protein
MSLCRPPLTIFALLCLSACGLGSESTNSHLGQPCSLGFDAGFSQAAYNPAAPECTKSSLCLKPVLDNAEDLQTAPYCSTTCSSDSDCHGQQREDDNSQDHRCTQGYACAIPFVVGPLCCQKMCVCKDFLNDKGAETPASCKPGPDGRNACEAL